MKVLKIERDLFLSGCFIYTVEGSWESRDGNKSGDFWDSCVYSEKDLITEVISEYIDDTCQDEDITFYFKDSSIVVTDINSEDYTYKIGDKTFGWEPYVHIPGGV